jgi:hypothetical protein
MNNYYYKERTMKRIFVMVCLVALTSISVMAQSDEPDPEIQKAKEETAVVYDLGRFFGYLLTMEKEEPKLALSTDQLEEIFTIMSELKQMERIEPDYAEEILERLELDILTPDQLMTVDQLAIAREESREPSNQRTGSKSENGGGAIQTYIAGGAFNPLQDDSKSTGESFAELLDYVGRKLGK